MVRGPNRETVKLQEEIRAALILAQRTDERKGFLMDDLFEECDSADDQDQFKRIISLLKAEGKINVISSTDEPKTRPIYGIGHWPQQEVSPVSKVTVTKVDKKKKPEEPIAKGAARFSISDDGVVGILKEDKAIRLDPSEIKRFLKFIDDTSSVTGE